MWFCFKIGSVREQLNLNAIIRLGPYPTGLVTLKEEEETPEIALSPHKHTEERPREDRERRQLSESQEERSHYKPTPGLQTSKTVKINFLCFKPTIGVSLVVQRLNFCLPMQGVGIRSLARKLGSSMAKKATSNNRSNTVTDSTRTLKVAHVKKNLK